MPSTRSAMFTPEALEAEIVPAGTQRALPPASPELRAPADVADRADARWRREHPAKVGRPSEDDETQGSIAGVLFDALREALVPRDVAEKIQCSPERAKELMTTARARLVSRIDEYVDTHLIAAKVAAVKGDAKPAQWALENIEAGGERAITPPKKEVATTAPPSFNVGFVIGGMPQPVKQISGK